MKIEMGESAVASWLRHCQGCQIVQTNWKTSPLWENTITDKMRSALTVLQTKWPEVFGHNSFEQMFKQAELDVLGVHVGASENYYYGAEVAFHENGLLYKDNLSVVTKKLIRTAMILNLVFGVHKGDVMFIAPKIHNRDIEPLNSRVAEIQELMDGFGFEFVFHLYGNDAFAEHVLSPLLECMSDVSDTSELFLRSLQLCELGKKYIQENPSGKDPTNISIIKRPSTGARQTYDRITKEHINKVAYVFSEYEHTALYPHLKQTIAFETASRVLGCPRGTLQNIRDAFDGHNNSPRRGWWQKPLADDLQHVKDKFDKRTRAENVAEAKEILGIE